MRILMPVILSLLPFSASAAIWLGDCDDKPYDVIVRNNGSEKVVRLARNSGEIQEYGAVEGISFQIKDDTGKQPVMTPMGPDEEFCIWSGRIKIQRNHTVGGGGGSF